MDRAQKEKVVEELGQIFESSGVVVVSRYEGLTVAEMTDLRARARAGESSVRVAKNKLARIALDGTQCESLAPLMDGHDGPDLFGGSRGRREGGRGLCQGQQKA